MALKPTLLTQKGLEKLEKELEFLKSVTRKDIAEKLKEARGHGDLSENSEYDEAMNEQGLNEARIAQIEAILKNVEIIDEDNLSTDVIQHGNNIKVLDVEENEERNLQIVGSGEVNVREGKISDESPIGKALLGHQKGDTVDVETPSGILQFKILDITK
ncbi:MAG: transcription elongation factor GreA [Ruminiclostridium sp.]|nr:transcription elongation factor GreA [Ruminiclostridium sp.]